MKTAATVYFCSSLVFARLVRSCVSGKTKLASILIDSGADVNTADEEGIFVLHSVCAKGNEEITKLLLMNNAEVNARTRNGTTALHYAAAKGHEKICRLLIEFGADIDGLDKNKCTPLVRAIGAGQTKVFRLLTESGAAIKTKDICGDNALHYAANSEEVTLCKLIIDMAPELRDDRNEDELLPLDVAGSECKVILKKFYP